MYTLLLIYTINYATNTNLDKVSISHLNYQECTKVLDGFRLASPKNDVNIIYGNCISEGR